MSVGLRIFLYPAVIAALWAAGAAGAQETPGTDGILSEDAAPEADVARLEQEAALFETIRRGVALALAQCELTSAETCTLTVSRDELERLLETLNQRITQLAERHAESGEATLEPVLVAYADARDGYSRVLEKLATVSPPPGAAVGGSEGPAAGEVAGKAGTTTPEAYEVFKDVDEALTDEDEELPDDE